MSQPMLKSCTTAPAAPWLQSHSPDPGSPQAAHPSFFRKHFDIDPPTPSSFHPLSQVGP